MSKCIHANKLHDNLWCSTACMYCTLSQEETCRHRKDVPDTNVVKTNADHIRSMSDEELAELLLNGNAPMVCPNGCDECNGDCDGRMLEWLKQPYKEPQP